MINFFSYRTNFISEKVSLYIEQDILFLIYTVKTHRPKGALSSLKLKGPSSQSSVTRFSNSFTNKSYFPAIMLLYKQLLAMDQTQHKNVIDKMFI